MTEKTLSKPLVVIVGPTASGKSGVAMKIARQFDGEIITADSRTIYKGLDVGTGKPTFEDQEEISHHCLDLVEPGERYTAAQFKEDAIAAINDIHTRDKVPIMVGGTGLYVDGVIFDFQFADVSDPEKRAKLETRSDEELSKQLEEAGDTTVNRKNRRHMIRFLETGGTPKDKKILRDNTIVVGIVRERNELRTLINKRVEQMFRAGLRNEVEELIEKYGWGSEALTGIGYREFEQNYKDGISMSKVKRDIIQDSLHYAKRQRTWFKRNPHIKWRNSAGAASEIRLFLEGQA